MFRIYPAGASFYASIVGADECLSGRRTCDLSRGIVTDAQANTVTFHLKSADPEFLYKLAMSFAAAVPAGVPDKDVGTDPLPATGPYVIAEYEPKQEIRLVRNPHFREWSEAAQPDGYADEIVWRLADDASAATTAVARGKADAVYYGPPPERIEEVRTQYASQLHAAPDPSTWVPLSEHPGTPVRRCTGSPRDQLRDRSGCGRPPLGWRRLRKPDLSGPAPEFPRTRALLPVYLRSGSGRGLEGSRS